MIPTLVVAFAIVAMEFTLSFWAATYLDDDVGLGRDQAVVMVSGLYAANLVGRLLASRLARRLTAQAVLAAALAIALAGTPALLTAHGPAVAAVGLAVTGIGIGATFPLISALHIGVSAGSADRAMGEVLAVGAVGQLVGPVLVGALAEQTSLRTALLVVPALAVLAAIGLAWSSRGGFSQPWNQTRPNAG